MIRRGSSTKFPLSCIFENEEGMSRPVKFCFTQKRGRVVEKRGRNVEQKLSSKKLPHGIIPLGLV